MTLRRVVLAATALVALALVIALLSALRLNGVANRLTAATRELSVVERELKAGDLRAADASLGRSENDLLAANEVLRSSPEFSVAGLLPVVRQNLSALRWSNELALRLVDGGRRVLRSARPLQGPDGKLNVSLKSGDVPLSVLQEVDSELGSIAFSLPGPSEGGSDRLLIGRVASLKRRVRQEAVRRGAQFTSAVRALDLLNEMAGGNGPRRYLLAVANTAEMRGAGGMILSYGVLSSNNGHFRLDSLGPIDDLKLAAPAPVQLPADVLARFSGLAPNQLWRNANMPLDFRVVGPVLEGMFTKATGAPVDGVIQIDSAGLGGLLAGVGPVDVPGVGLVTDQNVVPLTLNDAYVRFPTKPVRQEYLESVARLAFQRLVTGEFSSLTPLARGLSSAVQGRHILLHSTSPVAQRQSVVFGADGAVPPQYADWGALTVQNFSGNKLDYYLDTNLRLTGRRPPGRIGRLKAEVRITNTAPRDGRPAYVFGPFNNTLTAGEYRGLVTLYVPSGAFLRSSAGADPKAPPIVTTENGQTVVTFTVTVPASTSTTVALDVIVPPGPPGNTTYELVSTPRVRPTTVSIALDEGSATLRMDGPLVGPTILTARHRSTQQG